MDEENYKFFDDVEIIGAEFQSDLYGHFLRIPDIAKPLLNIAQNTIEKIEQMLYSAPAFINIVKASVPEDAFRVILTDKQKEQIASGALKILTKKDGSLMAMLVDPDTKKFVSSISLEKIQISPELTNAMANYTTQMQMAQIAEQMHEIQVAIEDVRQGQEYDRLATAYSCQQKLLQAMAIKNPELKTMALLRIVSDAEDSRNLLMQSQSVNAAFIQEQPESFWGKFIDGANPEKINSRMIELRESLCAVNMVSLVEAMAYQEMGESEAAQISLQYYADYVNKTYLSQSGFTERLDMIDPSPENYWSKTLPNIEKRIQALPCNCMPMQLKENENGTEEM